MDGRNEQSGAVSRAEIIGCFICIRDLVMNCGGIFVLFFSERMMFDAPKRPVNSGSSGWVN